MFDEKQNLKITNDELDKQINPYYEVLTTIDESENIKIHTLIRSVNDSNKRFLMVNILPQLSSISNSYLTLKFCLANGFYSDAFSLIRKIRDDLLQYLYIEKHLTKYDENLIKTKEIKTITRWLFNEELSSDQKKFFDYKNYKKDVIDENDNIKKIADIIFWTRLKLLSENLNSYVHGNSRLKTLSNDLKANGEYKDSIHKEIIKDIKEITDFFVSTLFAINPILYRSSDYLDYLELGYTPDEKLFYTLAPFIQNYIDTNLKSYKGLVELLRTLTELKIE